jgi:hypothetical protein
MFPGFSLTDLGGSMVGARVALSLAAGTSTRGYAMKASRLGQLLLVATALSVSAEERRYTAKSAAPELQTDTYTSTFPQGAAPPPADRAPYPDYRADDPPGAFDVERAAAFIDNAAVKWGRKHGCVTCHTNGH